jgi:hypothetical protein
VKSSRGISLRLGRSLFPVGNKQSFEVKWIEAIYRLKVDSLNGRDDC